MNHTHREVSKLRSFAGMGLLALLLVAPLQATIVQEKDQVSRDDYSRAKALLTGFDSAWSRGDLSAIMDPVSPLFGCELYGDVDSKQLRLVYQDLIGELEGTRCSTQVLKLVDDGELIQATVCRQFRSGQNELVEEQCQLFYLRKERSKLKIVGLEEFEHDGLEAIQGGTYRSPKSMFSFKIPPRTFLVPRPRLAFSLEHLLLRGRQLKSEVEIFLLRTSRPFELEQALDHDLEEWVRKHAPAKVELRTRTRVAGYPAMRAEVRYLGAACALGGRTGKAASRRLTRTYVQLDDSILLAIDLRSEATRHEESQEMLSRLLASLEIDIPRDQSYEQELCRRRGWGRLKDGKFVSNAAGFTIQTPPGFALDLSQGSSMFSLQASRGSLDSPKIRIDGVVMLDRDLSIQEMIEVDNAAFTRPSAQAQEAGTQRTIQVGGRTAIQVERPLNLPSEDQHETVVYVRSGPYLITVRVIGSLEQIRAASNDLEQILDSISIR